MHYMMRKCKCGSERVLIIDEEPEKVCSKCGKKYKYKPIKKGLPRKLKGMLKR